MSTPAVVWVVVGLGATAILGVLLVALVRQAILLGRTAMRLVREAAELTEGIGAAGRARTGRR
ncbi:MAG: hypothetical protein ACKOKE_08025 [Actinomycetota bacterium]